MRRPHTSWWTFAATLAGVAFSSSPSAAQEHAAPAVTLAWEAPSECPSGQSVEREIVRLLGARPEHPGEGLTVEARVTTAASGRLLLTLTTRGPYGEARRELEAESCAALAETAALVIAMAIDPEAVARVQEEGPAALEAPADSSRGDDVGPVEEPSAPRQPPAPTARMQRALALAAPTTVLSPEPPPPPREAPPADRGAGPPVRFVLAAGGLVGVGVLPEPSAGAFVAVGARVDLVELTLGGSFLAPTRVVRETVPRERGAELGFASARARGCVLFVVAPVELGPCAAIDVGGMWGSGFGVDRPASGLTPWVAAALAAEGRAHFVDALGITLAVELGVPFLTPDFTLVRETLHVASEVTFAASLGLLLRL